jgi:hypothetical protein
MPGSNGETREGFCDGLVQYSVGPIITLDGRITAWEYVDRLGNQVKPMIQTLFPNNDALYEDDNSTIHTAGTLQSWFEKHESELQPLPWLAQSQDLNIAEPLWSVLEIRVRHRFPPPTFLNQVEDVLQELYKNSARDCSKLVRVHSKKDCSCTEGKRWSNTTKKCVQYL